MVVKIYLISNFLEFEILCGVIDVDLIKLSTIDGYLRRSNSFMVD